jgi:aminoglycoside phosphotransferase (APT) family kinase protein
MPDDVSGLGLEAKVVAWIETHIGPVQSIVRQGRWRPAWFVEARADGKPVSLYVRGDRGGRWPPLPLAYEAKVQQILADSGVKVPKLYGYIEDIPALVMERVPGRPNMATAASDADRERLREQLADQMRLIHEVDPRLLAAAGSPDPQDPRELSLNHYRQAEALYLSGPRLPSPDMEFIRGWLNRNAPPCDQPQVIAMDAGQFIFEGDELTAMLDFEFFVIGDRHVDFAALRSRDRFEQIGDLESFYRLYEARGGRPVELDRVLFQRVAFVMYAPLEVAEELARPATAADYHEYLRWHVHGTKVALEDIALIRGFELAPYALPPRAESRDSYALEAIAASALEIPASDEYAAYRRDKLDVAARFLALRAAYRPALEAEYLADVAALTGELCASEWDGDVHLEAFVNSVGPEYDERLLRLLHRRALRSMILLEMANDPPRPPADVASG